MKYSDVQRSFNRFTANLSLSVDGNFMGSWGGGGKVVLIEPFQLISFVQSHHQWIKIDVFKMETINGPFLRCLLKPSVT